MIDFFKNNIYVRVIVGLLGCLLGLHAAISCIIYGFQEQMDPMVIAVVFLGLLVARGGIGFILNKRRINILDIILGLVFGGIAIYCFIFGVAMIWHDLKPKTGLGTAFGLSFTAGSLLPAFAAYRFLRKDKSVKTKEANHL